MANRLYGSYRDRFPKAFDGAPRGVRAMTQWVKKTEAEERNAKTPHDRTKRHRLGRCPISECGLSRVI